jgi:hypothetical protein
MVYENINILGSLYGFIYFFHSVCYLRNLFCLYVTIHVLYLLWKSPE